jgi:H+/Cl- antiporter ClcA
VAERLSLPADKRHWIVSLGRMGFAARGVVFLLIGGFLGLAALHASSSEVHGLGGALQALQRQPYGWVLLALTALGLFAFGLFGLVQARYRHIDAPDLDDAKAAVARVGR